MLIEVLLQGTGGTVLIRRFPRKLRDAPEWEGFSTDPLRNVDCLSS